MPPDETFVCDETTTTSTTATTPHDDDNDDKQYLFIIRHGDRWDYSNPEWKALSTSRLGDSPLSPLGHQQGRQVGQYLNTFFKSNSISTSAEENNITWLSSPFLRCIQTSNEAIQELSSLSIIIIINNNNKRCGTPNITRIFHI